MLRPLRPILILILKSLMCPLFDDSKCDCYILLGLCIFCINPSPSIRSCTSFCFLSLSSSIWWSMLLLRASAARLRCILGDGSPADVCKIKVCEKSLKNVHYILFSTCLPSDNNVMAVMCASLPVCLKNNHLENLNSIYIDKTIN